MSESLYWTWLGLKLGASSPYIKPLLERFPSPKAIFEADRSEILSLAKIPDSVRIRLTDRNMDRVERILADCRKLGIGIMTYGDPRYPQVLKQIVSPPAVLYFKGQPIDFDRRFCVAVVGTREMSEYGKEATYRLSYDLASAGAVIVSGLALGADGMATAGALDARAPSVAVLGSGIDRIYPYEHCKLSEYVLRDGLLLSEYPPGSAPDGAHFPQRNRIISGLARCTLVTEAPQKSGALITASRAAGEGRPIFAIPGPIDAKDYVGSNDLIKSGARLATSALDILDLFEKAGLEEVDSHAIGEKKYDAQKAMIRYGVAIKKPGRKLIRVSKKKQPDKSVEDMEEKSNLEAEIADSKGYFTSLSDAEKAIYDCIPESGDVSLDLLASASGQTMADVIMHTLSLSIKGAVIELPGNRFKRT